METMAKITSIIKQLTTSQQTLPPGRRTIPLPPRLPEERNEEVCWIKAKGEDQNRQNQGVRFIRNLPTANLFPRAKGRGDGNLRVQEKWKLLRKTENCIGNGFLSRPFSLNRTQPFCLHAFPEGLEMGQLSGPGMLCSCVCVWFFSVQHKHFKTKDNIEQLLTITQDSTKTLPEHLSQLNSTRLDST